MSLLERIQSPADVKALQPEQLTVLAQDIRDRLISVTSRTGGHIGPNLGVVELTIMLHRLFDTPTDSFVFDVAHQGYVHKLLTGRNHEQFDKIRNSGGLCGFLTRSESEHDSFGAGHAGTALSAALGMASARDLAGGDDHVVAVLGDAAFTCGITLEALNNVAASTKRLIIILNDNKWSIAKNVGAISRYLNELITNPIYNRIHKDVRDFLKHIPGGDQFIRSVSHAKMDAKDLFVPSSLFEHLGLRYFGPIDGHDFEQLEHYLNFAKEQEEPLILHVITEKGRGYDVALNNPEKFHGTGAFNIETGKSAAASPDTAPNYQDVVGDALVRFAKADEKVVGITAAMPSGTGLKKLSEEVPEQFFDVGIAEEHAAIFAAGMATRGYKPVVAIYSTFLQRAVDPIMHDVCLQNLPVLFCQDRAGLSPQDGPTHHGLFDIGFYRHLPNAVIMQPKDEDELVDMMHTGLQLKSPAFIRYPRGKGEGVLIKDKPKALPIGQAELLCEGSDVTLWALGPMVKEALALAPKLEAQLGVSVSVVNARFAKPIDSELLLKQTQSCRLVVTLEDHARTNGLGSCVLEALNEAGDTTPVERIGWPDVFIEHGSSVGILRAEHGLDQDSMQESIAKRWQKLIETHGQAGLVEV